MSFEKKIKEALDNHPFLKITIENHVTGFRVSLYDFEYGQINSNTGGSFEKITLDCISNLDEIASRKKQLKINLLEQKKESIKRELEKVNKELGSIKLNLFSSCK